MSSWLSISLPNPFTSDDDQDHTLPPENDEPPSPPTAGVSNDLSVLGSSIGRQLRGVAGFFAPPPIPRSPSPPEPDESVDDHTSQALAGIRNDLAEIGGSLRSSFSRLASNLFDREDLEGESSELKGDGDGKREDYEVAGTSDGVLDFVGKLSSRPELWTDFPLTLENDCHMSDAQQEHASAIEALVPGFANLRVNACSHLTEGKFWMIYFVLLLSRLDGDDDELLATPEVVDTRALLLQKLQNKPAEASGDVTVGPKKELKTDSEVVDASTTSRDAQKQPEGVEKVSCSDLEEDDNNELSDRQLSRVWLLGESSRNQVGGDIEIQSKDEKEVSVSDNSEEDNNTDLSHRILSSRVNQERVPSPTESNGWVRVGESSRDQFGGQETGSAPREKGSSDSDDSSSGWHNVNDVDLDIISLSGDS